MFQRTVKILLYHLDVMGMNGPMRELVENFPTLWLSLMLNRGSDVISDMKAVSTIEQFKKFFVNLSGREKSEFTKVFAINDWAASTILDIFMSSLAMQLEKNDDDEYKNQAYEYLILIRQSPSLIAAVKEDCQEIGATIKSSPFLRSAGSSQRKGFNADPLRLAFDELNAMLGEVSPSKQLIHMRFILNPDYGRGKKSDTRKYIVQTLPSSAGVWDVLWHLSQDKKSREQAQREADIRALGDSLKKLARRR